VDCARSGASFINDRCIKLLFMLPLYVTAGKALPQIRDKMQNFLW
jgi:hypothetical protein